MIGHSKGVINGIAMLPKKLKEGNIKDGEEKDSKSQVENMWATS